MLNHFKRRNLFRDRYFFDNVISAIGVILVWRGVWHLADMYLFPEQPLISNLVSVLVWIMILYLPDGKIDELAGKTDESDTKLSGSAMLVWSIVIGVVIVLGYVVYRSFSLH